MPELPVRGESVRRGVAVRWWEDGGCLEGQMIRYRILILRGKVPLRYLKVLSSNVRYGKILRYLTLGISGTSKYVPKVPSVTAPHLTLT